VRSGAYDSAVSPASSQAGQARADGISVVVTVLDDRAALADLLDALGAQTRTPEEVVVVDGGSSDGTRELLEERGARISLRVLVEPGVNISAGRNAGVRAAAHEWIAVTDAGCRPDPGWLAAIDAARADADFVAGVYRVEAETALERALADALYPAPEELERPSCSVRLWQRAFGKRFEAASATGRSMAFTRAVWERAGGFPEELYAGEDVAFSRAVVGSGAKARLATRAAVAWRPRMTWGANAQMYRTYARGDVRRGSVATHVLRAGAWLGTAAFALAGGRAGRLLAAAWFAAYTSVPLLRARARGHGPAVVWRIPLAIAMKDLSQIQGAILGLLDRGRRVPQPVPKRRA